MAYVGLEPTLSKPRPSLLVPIHMLNRYAMSCNSMKLNIRVVFTLPQEWKDKEASRKDETINTQIKHFERMKMVHMVTWQMLCILCASSCLDTYVRTYGDIGPLHHLKSEEAEPCWFPAELMLFTDVGFPAVSPSTLSHSHQRGSSRISV